MLTLVSERYLQLLCHPIPLCRVPTLRQHHPLHASSTPLLASSGCVDASVTAPVCPRLNVSLFFLSFCLCSLLLHCPFVPRPLPHAASPPSCCVPSLMLCPLPHAASPPSCHVCSLVLHPFSHATSSPPPALHQPPFPWPIPAASTSRPLCTVSDASVIIDAPPLHTVLCTRCAPTPFYTLTSPYACVCACSCVIVHLLLYMY